MLGPRTIEGSIVVGLSRPVLISIHQSDAASGKALPHLLHQSAGMHIGCREIFEFNPFFVEHGVITPFKMEVVALHETGSAEAADLNYALSGSFKRRPR